MNKSDSTHLHNAFVWVGERSAGFTVQIWWCYYDVVVIREGAPVFTPAIINPPLFKLY